MITLKIEIKQEDDNNIKVNIKTPKDTSKATDYEKDVAKHIVEKLKGEK